MALQSSGSISLANIAGEFGGAVPHSINEYYGAAEGIPSSGQVDFADFYGKAALGPLPTNQWFTPVTSTVVTTGTDATTCCIWYRRMHLRWCYHQSEIRSMLGGPHPSAVFTRIGFDVVEQPINQPLPNYAIGLKNLTTSFTSYSDPGLTGYTIVQSPGSQSFTAGTFKDFDTANFTWTGGSLAIMFAWSQCPTGYSQTGKTYKATGGTTYRYWTDSAGTYSINTAAPDGTSGTHSYRPVIKIKT